MGKKAIMPADFEDFSHFPSQKYAGVLGFLKSDGDAMVTTSMRIIADAMMQNSQKMNSWYVLRQEDVGEHYAAAVGQMEKDGYLKLSKTCDGYILTDSFKNAVTDNLRNYKPLKL